MRNRPPHGRDDDLPAQPGRRRSSPDQRDGALERIGELAETINATEPEVGTLRYVLGWFTRKIPTLAGTVRDLVLNPLVSSVVGAAGNVAAADFEQFLQDITT